jgi:hypothetical protein
LPPEPSRNGASTTARILKLVTQSCAVDLFHSRGVALAPLAKGSAEWAVAGCDRLGTMTLFGPKSAGILSLGIERTVFDALSVSPGDHAAADDLLRELTNQLAGRIKNRLLQFQVPMRLGLPTTVRADSLAGRARHASAGVTCFFRTLRGLVAIGLNGGVEEGSLDYSNSILVPKEGDFIAF